MRSQIGKTYIRALKVESVSRYFPNSVFLKFRALHFFFRVRKLKSTPIYVKPQLTSDGGTCRLSVMVGMRNDPGKTVDSVSVQFQLPPCILSADLTSTHGTVNILSNKVLLSSNISAFFFSVVETSKSKESDEILYSVFTM